MELSAQGDARAKLTWGVGVSQLTCYKLTAFSSLFIVKARDTIGVVRGDCFVKQNVITVFLELCNFDNRLYITEFEGMFKGQVFKLVCRT